MGAESTLRAAVKAFQQDLVRARLLTEPLITANPTSDSLHLMGLIECRSGRHEIGVEWLSRALMADRDNLNYRIMLARALVDSHRYEEAIEVAQPMAGWSPQELALLQVRAEAADGAKSWDISCEAWGRLSAANPGDWRAWSNAANAFVNLGRWSDAAKALHHAVGANPSELRLRHALASALARAGRYEESADELRRCVEIAPDDVASWILYARLLADLGRQEESRVQLDRAAKLVRDTTFDESRNALISMVTTSDGDLDLSLLTELAQLLERTNRADALAALIGEAEARGLERRQIGYPAAAAALREGKPEEAHDLLLAQSTDLDPIRWHWLMGRIKDALDDRDATFVEAQAMHLSVADYDLWRTRGDRHLQSIRHLAEIVTSEWSVHLKTLAADERGVPAFLVGFPRSGTTLLDTFLMGHPSIAVLEELPLTNRAQLILGATAELPNRSRAQLERARDAYFDELRRHLGCASPALVVDKLPLNMLAGPLLHSLFPDARFIFAQRHPCDAVLSCFTQAFRLNVSMACFLDLQTAAAFYDAAMNLWTRSKEVLGLKVHAVVYEELVSDPEGALRPLIEFLGLEWQAQLLDHRATAKARSVIESPSYYQVTQHLTRNPSGRWKRYKKHLEPVLPILMPWAERLGYGTILGT